jgi:hypothetical protein
MLDVLIWTCLVGRVELAKLLWEHMYSPIEASLIAASVFKMLSQEKDHPRFKSEDKARMKSCANEFERLAVQLLDQCCCNNIDTTQLALQEQWLDTSLTVVDIAYNGGQAEFVSHRASQAVLMERWVGGLAQNIGMGWVLTALIFFPIVPFLPFEPEGHVGNDSLEQARTRQQYGGKHLGVLQKYFIFFKVYVLSSRTVASSQCRQSARSIQCLTCSG